MTLDLPDMPGLDLLAGLEEQCCPGFRVIVRPNAHRWRARSPRSKPAPLTSSKAFDARRIGYVLAKARAAVEEPGRSTSAAAFEHQGRRVRPVRGDAPSL